MKNNLFIKKPKSYLIAFLVLFCGLFANEAMGQNTFWGNTTGDNQWTTAANWSGTTRSAYNVSYTSGGTTLTIVSLTSTSTQALNTSGLAIVGPGIPANTTITAHSAVAAVGVTIEISNPIIGPGTTTVYVYTKGSVPGAGSNAIIEYGLVPGPTVTGTPATITSAGIRNTFGDISGCTLTIDGTLNISSATGALTLAGGNVVNNGNLNITHTGTGASFGIVCAIPQVPPTSGSNEYSYTGSGALSINTSASTVTPTNTSGGISFSSANAFTTYKMLFNGSTTFNLSTAGTTGGSFAIRTTGSATASPVIIGGTGFTLGTQISPVKSGLINLGGGSNVTIDAGTTLTLNSVNTNVSSAITSFSSSATATNFTNKGTINILGSSLRSGLSFSSGASGTATVFNITNQGTLNVDLSCGTVGQAPFAITNGGGGSANAGTVANFINSGTATLKNTSTAVGTGNSIYCNTAGEAAPLVITNSSTLNLEGTTYNFGSKTTVNNTGILNTNSELRSFTAINNNAGGIINFVRTAATAASIQVVFNGLQATDLSGVIGSVYTDGTNNYTVVNQKFGSGTTLVANVLSSASIPPSGTLTSASGGTTPVSYTSVSVSAINGALPSTTNNSGTINTDTASNLNIISGVTTTSTSVIAPGGVLGKGIVDFAKAAATILGTLRLQVTANTTAGVDYDQVTNTVAAGTFNIAGATLDVTGIYTPVPSPTTIPIITTNTGAITGPFASVVGLTAGWKVEYLASTVNLVYDIAYVAPTTTPVWNGSTSISWTDPLNWTPNTAIPDANSDVTINTGGTFQPTISTGANIKSLTIDLGATLTVSGPNLIVKEAITNNGTLTILNNANLIQVDNAVNTGSGTTTVNRNSNALSRLDYTIWSSPTGGAQTLTDFSPATDTDRFYNYNETNNLYSAVGTPSATTFSAAAGYLIRMPNDAPTAPSTTTFAAAFTGTGIGVPNNGTIAKALLNNNSGYNMVGNPYPSTMDAQTFIAANTANIESSLYFWRKINGASGSAYAVYNSLGSTRTASSAVPNGTIQVGQGFFVKAKSGATSVSFTNAMRVANNQNQLFKTKAVQKDRVWLNLSRPASKMGTIDIPEAFSQALIGYTADATTGVDMYDAKYFNDSPVALTSSINEEEFTIQGRPTFDVTDVVGLNFKNDAAGNYTIALDQFDGVFATGQEVYLLDSKTGTETDLKAGSYTFNAASGTDNARFSLKYQKTLKVDAPAFNDNSVTVYKRNGTLYVNSGKLAINSIQVYDVQGRLIAERKNVKSSTASFDNLKANNQVLLVKILGEDNSIVTKKVLN